MAWILVTHKQYPLFSRYWMNMSFHVDMKRSLGMGFDNFKSLYNGIYADEEEFGKLKHLLVSRLESDAKSVRDLCEEWINACRELLEYTERLDGKDFSAYSEKEILNELDEVIKRLRKSASFIFMHHALDSYFETWLNRLLEAKVRSRRKRERYFQILSSPTRKTKLVDAKRDLELMAEAVKKNGLEQVGGMIRQYTEKYRWLGYDTAIGRDMTVDDTRSKLESATRQRRQKSKIADGEKIIKELGLSGNERKLLNLMGLLVFMGSYRLESHMIAGSHIRPLLVELARRFGVDYDSLVQFTPEEIKKALPSKALDRGESERRKQKFGLLMVNGKVSIYSGDDVRQIEEDESVPEGLTALKGLVANYGFARGCARIVMNSKDFGKVQDGDILVSKMANPDFIVVLEKCSGIVTDIGGVTSHAATIARELNKPCITGTRFATRIFRDGDLIEIDTEEATVRKV